MPAVRVHGLGSGHTLRATVSVLVATIVGITLLSTPAGASPAAALSFASASGNGNAYGADGVAQVAGFPQASIGQVAFQVLGCAVQSGQVTTNSVAHTNLVAPSVLGSTPVLQTGTIVNSGVGTFTEAAAEIQETSKVQNVSVLPGPAPLVTADVLTTTALVTEDATGLNKHTSIDDYAGPGDRTATGVAFVNLSIAGQSVPINGTVAPNTVLTLPAGAGTVTLNEQTMIRPKVASPAGGTQYPGVTVNAIHIKLTSAALTADFVVGHAQVRITPTGGKLSGFAFAAQATLDPLGGTGKATANYLPCKGTNGVEVPIVGVGVNVPNPTPLIGGNVLTSGTTTSIVNGNQAAPAFSHSTAQIQNLNLLNGLITADAVTSTANTDVVGGVVVSSGDVQFVNLVVNGTSITTPPLTSINLGGLGFVHFNQQRCVANKGRADQSTSCTGTVYDAITVTAIHVVVTVAGNPLGLPVGSDIVVAVAHSDVGIG